MDGWPDIEDAKLRARLALSDEEFGAFISKMAATVPPREFSDEIYERALAYPWTRPASSYLLSGERVQPVHDMPAAARDALLGAHGPFAPEGRERRFPLLAFGSNGAPETLAGKFGELQDGQRELLVLAGDLHDFDVGASPLPTWYGALPATIFPSPGTAVRAAVLWVTAAQLTMLAWSELSYSLGRLDGVRFQPDVAGASPINSVLGFVSRFGAVCVGGAVVAMDAVPARGRTARALTQERLLDHVAASVLGGAATARDLVIRGMEDFGATGAAIAAEMLDSARVFDSERWTRFAPAPIQA